MANYRKSFNFRSGVQVDTSNFIVNTNGLVGLGTTVPTQLLDVYGNIRSTGIVTSSQFFSGTATITSSLTVGSGVTITSSGILASAGIITATSFIGNLAGNVTGNVTGTASTAQGLIGTPNITVGIITATSSAIIGSGVTITSSGILASAGIITATSFVGNLTGSVTGNVTGNVNSTTGVSTFATLNVGTGVTISGGIVTATTFSGALTGAVTGNATGLSGTPNITIGVITATSITVGSAVTINSSGITATGIITAATFVGDGSGLTGVVGSGSGVIVRDDETLVGTAGTINFGTGLSVTPIVAGIVTVNNTGISSIFQDPAPRLFAQLDANFNDIINVGLLTATTTFSNDFTVNNISAGTVTVGTGATLTVISPLGVVNADGGFISVANTSPIRISLVGNQLTFTAVGIGSTTLTLA